MILIAGPYRSGTSDDPDLMAANLARLEEVSWPLFEAGHVPMIGEWVALPVLRSAGATGVTDPLAERVMYPTAQRLLQHCEALGRRRNSCDIRRSCICSSTAKKSVPTPSRLMVSRTFFTTLLPSSW